MPRRPRGRYLEDLGSDTRGSVRDRRLLEEILEPPPGSESAALATASQIQQSLEDMISRRTARSPVRRGRGLAEFGWFVR